MGGLVCDQIYSESPRSMGAITRAITNSITKAMVKMKSIPKVMIKASIIMDMAESSLIAYG